MPEEKKEIVEREVVVSEFPTQPINKVKGDDGTDYTLITTTEAMQKILDIVKELKKNLIGK